MRGSLYFGSVPSSIDASAAIEPPFVGSLGDATLNGIVINLDRAYDRDKDKEPSANMQTTPGNVYAILDLNLKLY